jgi:diguanylate cyclase (GGDEF)-like protein
VSVEAFYANIAEQLNGCVLILDLDCNIVKWNRFLQINTNKSPDEVIGQSIFTIFPELPKVWFKRKVTGVHALNTPMYCSWEQRHHIFELPHTRPFTTDSHFMAQNCTFLPIQEQGKVSHVCLLVEDVTDICYYQGMLRKTLAELEVSNTIDGLTQIFNRKYWQESLVKEFLRARRYTSDLCLIMLDLDHFKALNDNYGHQGGDMVLVEFAKIVKPLLRDSDIFGRYGGEEFAIILPETDMKGAKDVAERIRLAIFKAVFHYKEQAIRISTSVGVAMLKRESERYEELIHDADVAMYQAKSSGRNCVCIATNEDLPLL